jgi:small subunit ribosomal protein S4e
LFDGSNILIKVSDPKNPTEVPYRTLSTVIVKIPEREIIDYIPLEEGVYAIIFGGKNTGIMGKVKEIRKGMKRYRSLVVIETDDGSIAQTSLDYVLAIGREKPIIKLM